MALQVYQRYEIVFLSQHPLGSKLSHMTVAKAVHCDEKTVKRRLKRWKQSKDLTDAPRSGRSCVTTPKQHQKLVALAEQQTLVWNLPGKKKVVRTVKHPIKVNVWGWFLAGGFGRVYGLLPTVRKQFGYDLTLWKLQEDNDPKHTSKLATNWRMNNNVPKID
ncbi:unnamed protein product [Rotaria magnacalcarata]|uniref:Uncharacterized protein n=1 Tax=Rotaria magnacalcarata TaxID=392030 RepID=A0A8S2WTK3_9BILA|nr:unnamed protein product [Rotaria magnacalcarata]